jgi:hypothetical protein
MKKRIPILTMIALMATGLVLQSFNMKKEMKEKKVKTAQISATSEVINVSADKLWEIVGPGFGNVGLWSTTVDHADVSGTPEFEGATCSARACDLNAKGFTAINEKITAYNANNKSLSFDIVEGTPGFVTRAYSDWKIEAVTATTSRIKITTTMEMKRFMGSLMGGMIKKTLNENIPLIQSDLKAYAETGKPSKSKQERMTQLAAK